MTHRIRYVMIGGFLGAGKTTTIGRLARAYLDRVGLAITRGHVDGQRQSFRPVLHPHHGGVAAGTLHGIAENDVIVLLPDPALRA